MWLRPLDLPCSRHRMPSDPALCRTPPETTSAPDPWDQVGRAWMTPVHQKLRALSFLTKCFHLQVHVLVQ
jgi:hypothetical protein